jgi:molybdenum cofactor cytidylyltransferase
MKQLQALILAAGSSQRFPTNKLLRPVPGQTCLLDISYQQAAAMTPQVLLVINADDRMQAHCHEKQYNYLINTHAKTGMASSIVTGVTASADADGWVIFLADMPCITATTLQRLAEHWTAHEVTQPTYRHQPGHPVVFAKSWFDKLCGLTGDQGARGLLQDNPLVHHLETDDAGVCFDIDTEADWARYREHGCAQ